MLATIFPVQLVPGKLFFPFDFVTNLAHPARSNALKCAVSQNTSCSPTHHTRSQYRTSRSKRVGR
eukprot:1311926-Rhodomonas_salina.5